MTTAASQGSPANHKGPAGQTPNRKGEDPGKQVKVEMPPSITGGGPAAVGERTMPQTIQEGVEPADEEL